MTPQSKAKAAVEMLPSFYRTFDIGMQEDNDLLKVIRGLELLRPLAAGTHVLVPVEPTQRMVNAWQKAIPETWTNQGRCKSQWTAMLTASQEQE